MVKTPSSTALEVLADTVIRTGRYQRWKQADGVPIRSTVGEPKWWRHGPLLHFTEATPYKVLHIADDDEARAAYLARLDRRSTAAIDWLANVAELHPGEPLVVLCFENVHAGQVCHRTWFAEWMRDRHALEVVEVGADEPQSRLF